MNVWENAAIYHSKSIKNIARNKSRKAKKLKRLEKQIKKERALQKASTAQHYLEALKRNKKGLTIRSTKPEQIFKDALSCLGVKYSFQKIFMIGDKGYIVDFYLPDYLMVIEIDGVNHYEDIQDCKDKKRTENLLSLKGIIHVLRFDNEDVLYMQIDEIKRALAIKICPFVEDLL